MPSRQLGHWKYLQLHLQYLQLRAEKTRNLPSVFRAAVNATKSRGCGESKSKTPTRLDRCFSCPGQDLNLHGLPRYHLKVVRLPISPPGLTAQQYTPSLRGVEGNTNSPPVDWPAFRPMSPGAASRAKGHFEFAAEFSLGATVEIEGRFFD